MTDAKTWTHKGITITFDGDRAKFSAALGTKTLQATSLDAIKKKIDAERAFEPFPCYLEMTGWEAKDGEKAKNPPAAFLTGPHTGARCLVEATVISLEKPKGGRSYVGPQWRIRYKNSKGAENEKTEGAVLPRTPEALAAWKLHWETREACKEAEHQLDEANKAKLSPLHAAMPYRRASAQE